MADWPPRPANGGGFDEDALRESFERVADFHRRYGKYLIIALFGLVGLATSVTRIEAQSIGVVLRLGAYSRLMQPGLNFKLPFWIETVETVEALLQQKEEFGFRTSKAGVRSEYSASDVSAAEALMLTGDLNVATVEWIIQYYIRDPYKYLFQVRNVVPTLRDATESIMREVVGDRSVTEVLTVGREGIQVEVEARLQALCDRYDMGLRVSDVKLQDVNPPGPVRASFNEVNQATQEREKLINQAKANFNKVVPEARGKALQAVEAANGYATERVNRALGDVALFDALEVEYRKAPEVTRTRLYLEGLSEVLPKARRRIFVDPGVKNVVPLLNLEGRGK